MRKIKTNINVLIVFILFLSKFSLSQDIEIVFDSGFVEDTCVVEATFLGANKKDTIIYNEVLTTFDKIYLTKKQKLNVSYGNYKRVALLFKINGKKMGALQLDKKKKRLNFKIHLIGSYLVFNFSN